jgi:hypothetical protein
MAAVTLFFGAILIWNASGSVRETVEFWREQRRRRREHREACEPATRAKQKH